MRNWWMFSAACLWMTSGVPALVSQSAGQGPAQSAHVCECGAHPPAPPPDRTVEPYAGTPPDLEPYEHYVKPYYENYTHPNIYTGAARDIPDPKDVKEVRIGFLGPIAKQADQVYGLRMLHGAQMAIDDANARGGYGGKPFRLMVHDDYSNWQFGAEGGGERPTDPAIWGAPLERSREDGLRREGLGDLRLHQLRVHAHDSAPGAEGGDSPSSIRPLPIPPFRKPTSRGTSPTCRTIACRPTPWRGGCLPSCGLKRVALLRVNNRYGRMAAEKFRNAAIRLGHPVVIEQKFLPGDTDFARELGIIRDSRVDAIVLWADQSEAAGILKQMRAMGMKQRVFGAYRTLGPDLVAQAGPAAEGFEAVFPYDPTRNDPRWLDFNRRFEARFHEPPEQFASLAYDAMNILLDSICKAGLNRARIHDALADLEQYDGVTGHMVFDPNQKNVAPMFLGTVHNGAITYRPARMNKTHIAAQAPAVGASPAPAAAAPPAPYARVGEDGVEYLGPRTANLPPGPVRVIVFGRGAAQIAQSPEVLSILRAEPPQGPELSLLPVESGQNWGEASTQLVHALMDGHALAILALDRDAAHLAEQLALKCFVPVVALSNDQSLTSANIPWIFRLPAETTPAAALGVLRQAAAREGANPERSPRSARLGRLDRRHGLSAHG